MRGIAITVFAPLLVLAFPQPSAASAPTDQAAFLPEDPALAQLLAQALEASPELHAAQAVVEAQRQLAPQARALPDPMLELGIQNDSFTGIEIGTHETSWISIMAAQQVPWPGKLSQRAQLAELAPQQAQQQLERARLATQAEVQRAYLGLMLGRARLDLLGRLEELWRKAAEIARRRYEVGDGAQSDVLRAQLEQTRVKQRRTALAADERRLREALNQLRHAPLDQPLQPSTRLEDLAPPPPLEPAAAVADALERSPELRAGLLAGTAAELTVALEQQEYLPDLTLKAGVMPRGRLHPMWLLSIGGTFPAFASIKQSRAVEGARARVRAAASQVEALRRQLERRARERAGALAAQLDVIRLYQEGLLIQSQATADSTLAQYQVGKVGFLAVLEASAGSIADQNAHLEAIAEAWRLRIAAVEVSLEPVAGPGPTAMAAPFEASQPAAGAAQGGM